MAPRRAVTLLPRALPAWRAVRGMSQAALANAAGVSEGMIAQIETGRRQPGVENAIALAAALDVELGAIAFVHVDLTSMTGSAVTPLEAVTEHPGEVA